MFEIIVVATVKTMQNVRGHFAASLAFKAKKFLRMQ